MPDILKRIFRFFDKFEDRVRGRLSHFTIIYALISGVAITLFWRGVWSTADILAAKGGIWAIIFYSPFTIIWTTAILLATGLFVSFFVGDRIILSGVKKEKKIEEKTETEIDKEEDEIRNVRSKINQMAKDIEEIKKMSAEYKLSENKQKTNVPSNK
jgi:mannitol-specific phosphotransferase system IIBC component